MKRTALLIALAALLPMHAALATTTLTSVSVSPANPKAGETVTITINGTVESPNCGIRMEYGGGLPKDEFVLSEKGGQFPLTFTKIYPQAGTFKVEALGRKVGKLTFGCEGNASTMVTVAAAGRYAAPGAAAAPIAGPGCPDGWNMIAGQNDPSKGFTCAPMKPMARLDCGPWLTYFEKDGLIGCKKKK